MKFFKSYTGAAVVLAAAVLASILLGSHRSLTAERNRVEALFYSGTDSSGYSIATDLSDCLTVAVNLRTVAGRYLDSAALEALQGSCRELEAALDKSTHYYSIGNAGRSYQRLTEEAQAVITALEDCTLTEKDAQYVRGFQAELLARADSIRYSGYHQQAEQFNRQILGRFPANLLGRLTFVREAEAFPVS